jgi:drug/metabolite transporter superfamily protein YnfA
LQYMESSSLSRPSRRSEESTAYGGVFIILSVLWGWGIDKKIPDLYDWLGEVICLAGVSVMLLAPRQ